VVTRRLQAERRTGSVRRPKTGVLPTVLRCGLIVLDTDVGKKCRSLASYILGATYFDHLRLIEKHVVDFLLVLIELFL